MCNTLHYDSHEIPESGIAWKFFRRNDLELREQFFSPGRPYTNKNGDGFYEWDSEYLYDSGGVGFCGFPTREEAERCARQIKEDAKIQANWINRVFLDPQIVKVEYRQGIGGHMEDRITSSRMFFDIVLFKEFRVAEVQ